MSRLDDQATQRAAEQRAWAHSSLVLGRGLHAAVYDGRAGTVIVAVSSQHVLYAHRARAQHGEATATAHSYERMVVSEERRWRPRRH